MTLFDPINNFRTFVKSVSKLRLSDILPNPENPRVLRDEKFAKLKQSIQDFPKMMSLRPIVIDNMGMILGGNMRYRALQELGFKEIPDTWVKRAEELTVEEKRRFIIADNIGFGEWDWDELANNWDVEQLEEWGLDVPSFDDEKIEIEDDEFALQETQTDIQQGDLFKIGNHFLLCGDSTDSNQTAKLMQSKIADMVFTDPDFSMHIEALKEAYSNSLIHSKGFGFWICGDKQAAQLAMNDFENFAHFFVQDFRNATIISNTQAMSRHALICKFRNRKMNNLKDGFSTLLQIATLRVTADHNKLPMAKRIELPSEFIQHYTDPGDIVLDLFGHSGSTMMACDQLGRICYTQEIEPKYCQAIIDRMKAHDENILVQKIA